MFFKKEDKFKYEAKIVKHEIYSECNAHQR